VVLNAKTGQTIYELQTQLFERPEESSLSDKSKSRSRKKGGR
jgi:hypothetical protein